MSTKLYFCYNEYLGTGEGIHVWMSIESAASEDEAISLHQKRFRYHNYYLLSTEAHEINQDHKDVISQILKHYFSNSMVNAMLENASGPYDTTTNYFWGFQNLEFSFYRNRE